MVARAKTGSCPMDTILRLLMGPWTTYILWVLRSQGPQRFGALKRKVGSVSAKVLTERLRALEAARIIERHYEPTIPPQVTYSLDRRGRELSGALDELNRVALEWAAEEGVHEPTRQAADAAE